MPFNRLNDEMTSDGESIFPADLEDKTTRGDEMSIHILPPRDGEGRGDVMIKAGWFFGDCLLDTIPSPFRSSSLAAERQTNKARGVSPGNRATHAKQKPRRVDRYQRTVNTTFAPPGLLISCPPYLGLAPQALFDNRSAVIPISQQPSRSSHWLTLICFCLLVFGNVFQSSPAWATPHTSVPAINDVWPKVVKIFGAGGGPKLHAYGSGFLVSPIGHIVTVWSHILDGETVSVVLHDGRRHLGRVVGVEPTLDLAVLKIDEEGLPFFDLSKSASVGPGTRVFAFSNAYKVATGDEPVTVMHGIVAAKTSLSARRGAFQASYSGTVYVVDAVTNNSGAAGGVLTTSDGRLLGMIGKELRNTQTNTWLNYVMAIDDLKTTTEEIIAGKFASSKKTDDDGDDAATTGPHRYQPIDFGIVTIPDVVNRTPAYIDRVLPESQAANAGLAANDLILFVGDNLIQSCRSLKSELGRLEANDQIKIVVRRGDQLVTVELVAPKKGDVAEDRKGNE